MTNWGILSCLVKQTRLSWTDTQSSPYRGAQPCAAVTLHYTLGSLANIKSHQLPILACHPSSLTQLHVWNGNITAHRLSEKKRPLFFKPGNFFQVLSCEIWNPCMDSFFFFKPFPAWGLLAPCSPSEHSYHPFPLEFSGYPPLLSSPHRTFVWLVWLDWEEMGSAVILTGGNRIHSHLIRAYIIWHSTGSSLCRTLACMTRWFHVLMAKEHTMAYSQAFRWVLYVSQLV